MTVSPIVPEAPSPLEMQHVLNAFEGVVAIVDVEGVIVAVNQAWTNRMDQQGGSPQTCGIGVNYLLVCERASATGITGASLVADGLRAGLAGTAGSVELEFPCHSPAQDHWSRLHIRPFETRAGRHALLQHDDVTAHIQAKDEAAGLQRQIQQRSELNTQMLKTQNEELDAFVGAVSHDLHTPVRHIHGFLTLLRRKVTDDRWTADEQRLLDVIGGASDRLQQMITELLKLARVSQTALHLQDVDLTKVMRDAWAGLTAEIQGRDLNWVLEVLPVVKGDPALLRLAFENVLSNALKYTGKQSHASIRVWATWTEEGWVVAVQDDGVGFDPARASKLFGTFQRLHSDREFAGVGMGLANVKRICVRHGGEVWAEGQVGKGTTFFIRFPVHREVAEAQYLPVV